MGESLYDVHITFTHKTATGIKTQELYVGGLENCRTEGIYCAWGAVWETIKRNGNW